MAVKAGTGNRQTMVAAGIGCSPTNKIGSLDAYFSTFTRSITSNIAGETSVW